ncbi:MAG TPA: tyrosine--tRNA ligase [Dehalococcoidia bacterium]|nr:tyrosine--tRNA ligase [Dehalococcoidia bacterium]
MGNTNRAGTDMPSVDEQVRLLMRGVVYGDEGVARAMESELRERLAEGRPLRIYLGIDPTAPDLTLGHTVPMRKLRQFQQLGHEAVLLIGGFTALVGDPSDKESARPMLTLEEIEANGRTYAEQAFKILDRERTVVRNNAEWLSKLTFEELIKLASNFTVGQFLQRDNFARRRERGDPIYVHEFFYAFMQAYDAVALETDAQVGATEQLFNLMAGRTLQRSYGQRPQVAICMPILVGTDGRLRMSKSQGNYIALNDPPEEMYGKVMSLPDDVMIDYFTLVTDVPSEGVEEIRRKLAERLVNPMDVKKRLAREIVTDLHGAEAAHKAEESFERTIQRGELPQEAKEVVFRHEDWLEVQRHGLDSQREAFRSGSVKEKMGGSAEERQELVPISEGPTEALMRITHTVSLPVLLVKVGLADSRSAARRLIDAGAVKIGGEPCTSTVVTIREGETISVGSHRFVQIVGSDEA